MPPMPPVTDAAQATFVFHNGSSKPNRVNVLHFQASTSGSTLQHLHDELNAHLTSDMWGLMTNDDTCTDVELLDLRDNSTMKILHLDDPIVGQGSGQYIPNTCALIKLLTDQRGRSFRGRVYIPDLAESFQDNGQITQANQEATTTAWEDFANAMVTDATWALGVVSRFHNKVRRNPGIITQVTQVGCESQIATQRRRSRL